MKVKGADNGLCAFGNVSLRHLGTLSALFGCNLAKPKQFMLQDYDCNGRGRYSIAAVLRDQWLVSNCWCCILFIQKLLLHYGSYECRLVLQWIFISRLHKILLIGGLADHCARNKVRQTFD